MSLEAILGWVNLVIGLVFTACYAYQYAYIFVALFTKPRPHKKTTLHRYAVLVAARNEQAVIGELIASVRAQDYPAELVDIYVIADNCTDDTAGVARAAGATVFERTDRELVGKGYALDFLLTRIHETVAADTYDAFLVFDADNLLEPDYITEMNKTFSDGYRIITGYRNSKNFGDNWISAGYALWFLRESALLNYPRHLVRSSCAISGTGFLFSRVVLEELGGWKFFTLTEDLEFTAVNILRGERIGFCREAVLYDEQPVRFRQSWRQRLRWSSGSIQILKRDGRKLWKGCFTPGIAFPCFDFTFNMFPAYILSVLAVFVNAALLLVGILSGQTGPQILRSFAEILAGGYGAFFILGAVTTATEWKRIHATTFKKLWAVVTFPLFAFTFVPISIHALFAKPQWKPIEHSRTMKLEDVKTK